MYRVHLVLVIWWQKFYLLAEQKIVIYEICEKWPFHDFIITQLPSVGAGCGPPRPLPPPHRKPRYITQL